VRWPPAADRILLSRNLTRIQAIAFLGGVATFLAGNALQHPDFLTIGGVVLIAIGVFLNWAQQRAIHHEVQIKDSVSAQDSVTTSREPQQAEEAVEEGQAPPEGGPAPERSKPPKEEPKRSTVTPAIAVGQLRQSLAEGEALQLSLRSIGMVISAFSNPAADYDLWVYRTRKLLRPWPQEETRFTQARAPMRLTQHIAVFPEHRLADDCEIKCAVLQKIIDRLEHLGN
jgi:hypothetical protein